MPDPGCPGKSSINDQSAEEIFASVIAPADIYFIIFPGAGKALGAASASQRGAVLVKQS
jgi:hypothetical protein